MKEKEIEKKIEEEFVIAKNFNTIEVYQIVNIWIVKKLINTRITPNQITFFGFLCCVLSAYFFSRVEYVMILAGLLFFQLSYLSDYVDGTLSRVRGTSNAYGAWLDLISGTFGWFFVFIGITIGVYSQNPKFHVLLAGFLTISALFLKNLTQLYYTSTFKFATKFRKEAYKKGGSLLKFSRFTITLLVPVFTLGAIFNKMYYVLLFCGIYGPLYAIAQIIILTLRAKKNFKK